MNINQWIDCAIALIVLTFIAIVCGVMLAYLIGA